MHTLNRRRPFAVALAAALACVLAFTVAPVESAAGATTSTPTVTVSKTQGLTAAGDTITVSGSGFVPNAPATDGTRRPLQGVFGGVYVVLGAVADVWKPSAGAPSTARQVLQQKWVVNPENVATVGGAAAGAVAINPDGSFSIDFAVSQAAAETLTQPNFGVYTFAGSGAVVPSFETFTPLAFAPTPTVTVSKTTGLDPAGDTITVTGTGFSPNPPATDGTRRPLQGVFGGVYVTFGAFLENWKPSAGAPSSARPVIQQKWVVNPENVATVGGAAAGAVPINPDGSFSIEFSVATSETAPDGGRYGIYTFSGSGASYTPFETYTALNFADPEPDPQPDPTPSPEPEPEPQPDPGATQPTVSVSATTGLNPAGQTITVRGTGFTPNAPATNGTRPPLMGQYAGTFVILGSVLDVWKPSQNAPPTARQVSQQRWVVGPEHVQLIGGPSAGAVPINPDGSFTVTFDVSRADAERFATGTFGVFTYAGSGAVYAPYETFTPLTFAADGTGSGPRPTPTPTVPAPVPAPVTEAPRENVTAGSLVWGVKQSFREYMTGTIARGSITAAGVGQQGANLVFPQAGPSPTGSTGTVAYSGQVRYLGHSGLLDVTLRDPRVTIESASRASLSVVVNGTPVSLATLNLAAGTRTESADGSIRYSGVPATLTRSGTSVFSFQGNAFYPAGTALDPVTFTIGSPAMTGGGGAVAGTAIAPGAVELARFVERRIPAEPPATTGAELVGGDGDLLPGARIEARATGFAPGEEGILVVVYSEPRLLGEVTADASGQAVWTGRLPDDLVGQHTLTFQGSVDRGVVLQIVDPALTATDADQCVVTDAQLDWGFKESFRAYVSGSIARGGWEVLDGAEYAVPLFTFGGGTGAVNPAARTGEIAFAGAIRFTGHEGILDTLIANPRIVFTSSTTAELIADLTGTRQDFEEVEARDVRFLELNLAGATSGSRENGTVTITGIPTTLTVAGAEAFGTYPAGEEFDPITLAYSIPSDCAASPATAAPADLDGDAANGSGADPAPAAESTSVLIAIIAVLLAVIVALAVMVLRRRAA